MNWFKRHSFDIKFSIVLILFISLIIHLVKDYKKESVIIQVNSLTNKELDSLENAGYHVDEFDGTYIIMSRTVKKD